MVIIFSVSATRCLKVENCGFFEFYFNLGNCEDNTSIHNTYLHVAYIIFPFALSSNMYFLFAELAQLNEAIATDGSLVSGLGHYFSSIWNYLDVLGFGFQVIAQALWVCNMQGLHVANATRLCLAIACMLLATKTMYFARGYERWGPMVRMIIEIISDMGPFIVIVLWFLGSFSIALLLINEKELPYILIWNSEKVCDFSEGMGVDDSYESCECQSGECSAFGLFFEYVVE